MIRPVLEEEDFKARLALWEQADELELDRILLQENRGMILVNYIKISAECQKSREVVLDAVSLQVALDRLQAQADELRRKALSGEIDD
jgi:hypothetical protein